MQRLLSGLAALGLALALTGPAPADYDFTTLPDPGAASRANAPGINGSGQVDGSYIDPFGDSTVSWGTRTAPTPPLAPPAR